MFSAALPEDLARRTLAARSADFEHTGAVLDERVSCRLTY